MHAPILRTSWDLGAELVVDNFAGGGGASTGIEAAIGRPVDMAINHSPEAIAMHGMRMLQPHELFAAQGFPGDYDISPEFNGKPLTKTAQTALAGNSVCPQVAEAIVGENAGTRRAA